MRVSRGHSRARAGILGCCALLVAPPAASAQTTLDGSHCIHFPGTVQGEIARCALRLPAGHPLTAATLTVSLLGTAPNGVNRIALALDGRKAFQVIVVAAEPPVGAADIGLWFADMNFDGLVDFGLMTSRPAAVEVTYRWFIFDPQTGMFADDPALSALRSVRPDPARRRVLAGQRESGERGRSDVYRWQGRDLRLEERIERLCAAGKCTCRSLRPARHGYYAGPAGPCR